MDELQSRISTDTRLAGSVKMSTTFEIYAIDSGSAAEGRQQSPGLGANGDKLGQVGKNSAGK